ncbi:MAG: ATP-binding protein [Verrucomicrobia bacterium]|nr:ATP-binding protein [Verrucomicrobiota bacterium]
MAFVAGPRQVGKTTTCMAVSEGGPYFNWDHSADRLLVAKGAEAVAEKAELHALREKPRRIVFDEIHKFARWKSFLKGFFDVYGKQCRCLVTGSSRLDLYKRGGDSLMGRYFLYRMHPLSLAEISSPDRSEVEVCPPRPPAKDALDHLLRFGGYPEPFLKGTQQFFNRWRRLRLEQFFREDLRDLSRIQEIGQIQILVQFLAAQVGQLVNYSNLAREISVSVDTIRRWIVTLESLYVCFNVRPWHHNVAKSLRKQPKVFLWDWTMAAEGGARRENLVASHLLKAVHFWTDTGLADCGLFYLRDKMKREVDFVVTRDGKPWFMVEVKSSEKASLNPNLFCFQKQTGAAHAFQVAFGMPFVARNCFEEKTPVRVPAETLLSQLV